MTYRYTVRNIIVVFIVIGTVFSAFQAITYGGGPPVGTTSAPGENDCTGCHNGSLITSGSNWNNLTLTSDIPSTGYIPDSSYTFTLSHSVSGINKYGFELTILQASNNTKAGTMTVTSSSTTQIKTGSSKEYIMHTSGGTSGSGSKSWSFNWKAPSSNVGDIKVYTNVNAANGNNTSTGDAIYAKDWTFSVSSLLPTAVITTSKTSICVGDTLFLTGSGNNSPTAWAWTMTGGSPSSSNSQNTFVIYSSAGSKTISLQTTNSKGKSSVTTKNISVISLPSASITIKGNTTLCQGDSVILTGNPGTGFKYLWNTSETSQSIIVKSAGKYHVTVSNASGCMATSADVSVAVNPLPVVVLKSSIINDTICSGESVTFNASSGFKGYTFVNNKAIVQKGVIDTVVISNLSSGNLVSVLVTDNNGCVGISNTIETKVISPSASTTISCGTATTQSVEFIWPAQSGVSGYEVSIDSGKTWAFPSSGKNGLSNIQSGLTYSQSVNLWHRSLTGFPCTYSEIGKSVCVSLPCSKINYTLDFDSTICKNNSTDIVVSGLNISNYSINFENNGYSKTTSFKVSPTTSTIYQLSIIDSNALNCPSIQVKIPVNVEQPPAYSFEVDTLGFEFCKGSEARISAIKGYQNYQFIRNQNETLYNGQNPILKTTSFANNDSIKVIVKSNIGCEWASPYQTITIHDLPIVELNLADSVLCKGDILELNATKGLNKYYFIMNNQDTIYQGVKSDFSVIAQNNNDHFQVLASDQNGCMNLSAKHTITVNDLPKVGFTYIANGLNYQFNDTTKNSIKWFWDFGLMETDSVKNPVHVYNLPGIYNVTLKASDKNLCSDTTSVVLKVKDIGINENGDNLPVNIFYQPITHSLVANFELISTAKVIISIQNINGNEINILSNENLESGLHNKIFDLGNLSKGIYIVRYTDPVRIINVKVFLN